MIDPTVTVAHFQDGGAQLSEAAHHTTSCCSMPCAGLARTTASTTRARPHISLAFPPSLSLGSFRLAFGCSLLSARSIVISPKYPSLTGRQAAKLHCLRQFRAPQSSPSPRGFPRFSLPKPVSQVERALGPSEITISGQSGNSPFQGTRRPPVCIAAPPRPVGASDLSPANPWVRCDHHIIYLT